MKADLPATPTLLICEFWEKILTTEKWKSHHHHHHHHHHWLESLTWALAFLRSFCQQKYPAIASSDFVTNIFQGGVVSPTHNSRLSWRADVFRQGCLP
jgi:hypothetical protein